MRDHLHVPLVATVHATEAGRHQGWLPGDLNRAIHSVECWLGAEADRVLVCSKYMGREVEALLGISPAKTTVIPNGVDLPRWSPDPREVAAVRSRYAGDGPLIGFAGRLVYEKGVQHLLHAVPELRRRHRGLRVVIAGDGPQRGELEATAGRLELHHEVSFTGFVPAPGLSSTMASTDAMVVPSIYEPFGLVALEAAAAGAPLAVSETGGLAEIVEPGVTGLRFPVRDAEALTESVSSLISDREAARAMAEAARTMVRERYGWDDVAKATAGVYASVVGAAKAKQPANLWHSPDLLGREPLRIPEGNLLESAGLLP
jgi:glycogen(starch) synthase